MIARGVVPTIDGRLSKPAWLPSQNTMKWWFIWYILVVCKDGVTNDIT